MDNNKRLTSYIKRVSNRLIEIAPHAFNVVNEIRADDRRLNTEYMSVYDWLNYYSKHFRLEDAMFAGVKPKAAAQDIVDDDQSFFDVEFMWEKNEDLESDQRYVSNGMVKK